MRGSPAQLPMTVQLPSIDITSRTHAAEIFCRPGAVERYDHVISINDGRKNPPAGFVNYEGRSMALFFDDFTEDMKEQNMRAYEPPLPMHMEAILRFAEDIGPGETLLCHCNAGISRSTAAGAAVLASKLTPSADNAREVMKHILQERPQADPNRHLIRYADEQLAYGGALARARAEIFGSR